MASTWHMYVGISIGVRIEWRWVASCRFALLMDLGRWGLGVLKPIHPVIASHNMHRTSACQTQRALLSLCFVCGYVTFSITLSTPLSLPQNYAGGQAGQVVGGYGAVWRWLYHRPFQKDESKSHSRGCMSLCGLEISSITVVTGCRLDIYFLALDHWTILS